MNPAVFIHGAYDVRLGTCEKPVPIQDHTVVQVQAVGICGSDLHYYKDGSIGSQIIQQPFIPGHEFSACLSEDIEHLKLSKGQLVAVDPATPCHRCEWCIKSHHNLCPHVKFIGAPPFQGALTPEISVPLGSLIAVPDHLDRDQVAMLEPLGVCIHAVDLAAPRLLESVTVLGCGPIGLGILQLLKLAGVGRIIAVDPQAHRTALARDLGADDVGPDLQVVMESTGGLGSNLVMEATNSPAGLADAVNAARIGGRVVLVGIPDGDEYDPLSAAEARRRGLTIRFSRRMGTVYPRAIQLVEEQRVNVDALVTHRFSLEDTAQAFALQADESDGLIKSIVYPC